MSCGKCDELSRRVEISSVGDLSSSNFAARGTAIPFLDGPRSKRGSGGCVVRLYDPRLVHLDADRGVVADLEATHDFRRIVTNQQPLIRVYREVTGRRETGVDVDEESLYGHPSLNTSRIRCVVGEVRATGSVR